MAGVGDIDQCFGPLYQVFAIEIRNTVFGDYVVHMCSGGYDPGTFFQQGYNAALAFAGIGGQSYDGFSTLR
jgi:hypothetical protein